MSPLRALFLSFARLPPAVVLLIVTGLAVAVTMTVTKKVGTGYSGRGSDTYSAPAGRANQPGKHAVYSLSYIPAGSRIESKQIELRQVSDLELWDDAELEAADVTGGTARHAIPAQVQIRKSDLE